MGIQNWSENVILINLAKEPQMGEELQVAAEMVTDNSDCNLVVDFADVDIVTSSSIAKLLKLRKIVSANGCSLLFASASPQVRNIFTVTGLDSVFEFVDDQFIALAGLQLVS